MSKATDLIELRRMAEDDFAVVLNLGFTSITCKGTTLRDAASNVGFQLNRHCWANMDGLLYLPRKFNDTIPVQLEQWCNETWHYDTQIHFTFVSDSGRACDRILVGSNGPKDILDTYRTGKKLFCIREIEESDKARLDSVYWPKKKGTMKREIYLNAYGYIPVLHAHSHSISDTVLGKKAALWMHALALDKLGKAMECKKYYR